MDDALAGLTERLTSLTTRFVHQDESIKKLDDLVSTCVTQEQFEALQQELTRSTETTDSTSIVLENIQRDLKAQQMNEDDRWGTIKKIFREQMSQYVVQIEDKVGSDDLEHYVKHTDLADLVNLLKNVPEGKRQLIPEILPEVLADTSLTMSEKVTKIAELLAVERSRIETEKSQVDEAFRQLSELESSEAEIVEVLMRDIGTGPDGVESDPQRLGRMIKGGKRVSKKTAFQGPEESSCEREEEVREGGRFGQELNAPIGAIGEDRVVLKVLGQCQGIIERQLHKVLQVLGVRVDRNDIMVLVNELRMVEELQRETNAVKLKLATKVDNSEFQDALKHFVLREELYQ
jgi:hypothetical protein